MRPWLRRWGPLGGLSWVLAFASACESGEASQSAGGSDESGAGGSGSDGSGSDGSGSGGIMAPCEEQPTVTYDTFGRGFLATYCDGCHGSEVADRQSAPAEVVFDTRQGAQMWTDRIIARAAPPDGSEPTMPAVGGVTPRDTERLQIWLTCFP